MIVIFITACIAICILAIQLLLYPYYVAKHRKHNNIIPVLLVSFIPVVGFFGSLAWAFSSDINKNAERKYRDKQLMIRGAILIVLFIISCIVAGFTFGGTADIFKSKEIPRCDDFELNLQVQQSMYSKGLSFQSIQTKDGIYCTLNIGDTMIEIKYDDKKKERFCTLPAYLNCMKNFNTTNKTMHYPVRVFFDKNKKISINVDEWIE